MRRYGGGVLARGGAACALGILLAAAPARAHEEDRQFWVVQAVTARIDPATSIAAELSERARAAAAGEDQLLGRITLTRRLLPGVDLALGVSAATSAGIGEIRPEQAIILTHGPLSLRSRLEERMIDGVPETVLRLRERVLLQLPLDDAARWTLHASGEAFFQLNRGRPGDVTGFNTLRTQIGARHALTPALALTLLYQRQQAVRPGRADGVSHMPVVLLAWTF